MPEESQPEQPPFLSSQAALLRQQEVERQNAYDSAQRRAISSLPVILSVFGVTLALVVLGGWLLPGVPPAEGGPQAIARAMTRFSVLLVVGLLATIFGAIFFARARAERLRSRVRTSRAGGFIAATELERIPAGRRAGYLYRVAVSFQFEADGRAWTGTFRPSSVAHNGMSRHEATRRRYPPGSAVAVAFDPADPSDATLVHNPARLWPWGVLLFGIGCPAFALALLYGWVGLVLIRAISSR